MSNASLFVINDVILGESDYTFTIHTGYDLGDSPRILVEFPLAVDLSSFASIMDCEVLLDIGIGDRICTLYENNTNMI